MDADLVTHEATLAVCFLFHSFIHSFIQRSTRLNQWLGQTNKRKPGTDEGTMIQRGHSTAREAGEFAASVRAKALCLTHFGHNGSFRSLGNSYFGTLEHVNEAKRFFDGPVVAASDFMKIDVLPHKPKFNDLSPDDSSFSSSSSLPSSSSSLVDPSPF